MINFSSYRTYHMQVRTQSADTETTTKEPPAILQMVKGRFPKYLIHIPVWLFLYFLPQILLFAINTRPYFSFTSSLNAVHLLSFMLVIIFSYLHYYWLLPWFFKEKKLVYVVSVTALITCITGLQYMAETALAGLQPVPLQYSVLPWVDYNFIVLIASMFSAIIVRLQEDLAAGKQAIIKTKLSLLNIQINPHFLFNSLNWIYLLAIEKSGETPKAIAQLSGLMRYILKEPNSDCIDLKKELDYISNYVSLQKGRLGNTILLNCSVPAYTGAGKIAPLLAMSFIENAFKHGVNPNEDSAIHIDISISGNQFFLQVINNKVSPSDSTLSAGVGIKNARQRLRALYPCLHQLEILEDDKIYSVKLSINLL